MLKVLGVAVVSMVLGLAVSSSALATTGHSFSGYFGTAGGGVPGGFSSPGPGGLAVRQSNGDVYVADPFNVDSVSSAAAPRVERFDAAGVFQSEFAIDAGTYSAPGAVAVGPSGGGDVVYVGAVVTAGAVGAVLRYSAAGVASAPLSSAGSGSTFANPVAIAADSVDGSVYVSAVDTASGLPVIDKFSSAGVFQAKFDGADGAPGGAALVRVESLAVDGAHRLLVSDGLKVYRYSATGTYQLTVDDPSVEALPVRGVAANATTNEVYVNEPNDPSYSGQVRVFDAAGALSQPTFATPAYSTVLAVAVAGDGTVYGTDANNVAGLIFAAYTGPTVVTGTGTPIDAASETLNGTINPEGVAGTTYHFEYGADANYGNNTPDVDPGSGSSAVAASDVANVGLQPSSTYHFRLVGVNPSGTIYGADNTFTTAPGPPVVDGAAPFANPIASNGATLNGTVDPRGSATSYHFDYGTDTSYGSVSSPNGSLAAGQGAQGASSAITGLVPNTVYHFRVVADNGTGGPQVGADQTFITAPAGAASATDITAVKASLTGVVNPRGSASSYHFEYTSQTASPVTETTAETDAGAADADTPVSAPSGTLRPGTAYTVRVVTTDLTTNVTTTGAPGTFTTDPGPGAVTGGVSGVTPSAATFAGSYDTKGHGGSYQFVIGSSTSPYLVQTDPVTVTGAGTASGGLANLPAGQTYHVRLSVRSDGATVLGDSVTFSTPAQSTVAPPAPGKSTTVTGPYGCTAPVLAAYNQHPKAGETITITGSDLGVGGNAILGTNPVATSAWSVSGFTITVPDDATGSLPLTVNCGAVSNTIAIQIYQAPSNAFTATAKAGKTASTVTVVVKVPGPGSITVTGTNVKTATKHAGAAGTSTVKVTLTAKASKSLKRHHQLTVALSVRFTPTGGTSRTISKRVTFTRQTGH